MKRKSSVFSKLLLGMLAVLLVFSTPDFAYAGSLNEQPVVAVAKASGSKKPSVKQLKATLVSVSYVSKNANLYYKVKFTNKSSVKITKAKIHTEMSLDETVVRDKTVTLNLAPNKSKTVKIYMDKVVQNPGKKGCSLKVTKLWYK